MGRSAKPDEVLPLPDQKADIVRRMFGAIAPRYDLLNRLLSFNRDRAWRRRAVDRLLEASPADGHYLDACAGTLELTVELARRANFTGSVTATDFSFPMLRAGGDKRARLPIDTVCGDALLQPFRTASFDGAMVAFGLRNLASTQNGLSEFARLIRPGGKLVVLEFTTPQRQPFRWLYLLYFRKLLPLVGRLVSGHKNAYDYLPESVLKFPEPPALSDLMRAHGFQPVHWKTMTGGIVALHVGVRTG